MAIDTYTNLKAELAQWVGRRSDLATQIDTAIDLFEAWASRNLRVRQMEAEATAVAAEYLALPDDFMELRDIQWQGSQRRELSYVTPEYADRINCSGASGTPSYYTLVGDQLRLVPPPDSATPIRIDYWQRIPALSGTQATNWLLDEYGDAYLYGSLMHLRAFLVEPELVTMVMSGFAGIVREIQKAGLRSNVGSSLTVRAA